MEKLTRIYYILIGIPVLVISVIALIDSFRSGELRTMMRDPGFRIVVACSLAAVALAMVYFARRGAPTSENQIRFVVMIALGLAALVAVIVAFIFMALTGGV